MTGSAGAAANAAADAGAVVHEVLRYGVILHINWSGKA